MFDFAKFQASTSQALERIRSEIGGIRTGGASPVLLDPVKVEAYGTRMKITELAAINVADPTLLVINPWDKSVIGSIEKAIQQAGLNLNPVVDGDIIRISVPPLTQEGREQLVKTLHRQIEEGKVAIRAIRTDTKKLIDAQDGSAGISQDDIKADLARLEDETKKVIAQIDELAQTKEAELLKV